MEQTRFVSRLRYLDAEDVDDSVVDFDGLDVRGADGEKLGEVDGFLVDPGSHRVLYTVVDSGGWFSSRRFLLPIGHTMIDRDSQALLVDVSRQTLNAYPEFDERRFNELSDDEFRTYEQRMASACCSDEPRNASSTWTEARHYQQPGWWPVSAYAAERLSPIQSRPYRERTPSPSASPVTTHQAFDRDLVTARSNEDRPDAASLRDRHPERDEHITDDVSPHYAGRAQPGDVLGIETGGETTGIGDTVEDENNRRRKG